MPRKKKGVHTCPENAGAQNFSEDYLRRVKLKEKDDRSLNGSMVKLFEQSMNQMDKQKAKAEAQKNDRGSLPDYNGLWTEEELRQSILDYFKFCDEEDIKPAQAGLASWLGTSKTYIHEWINFPERYGYKSELCRQARQVIEMQYIGRAEQYPTANTFLLRTSHDHIERSKVDIETNNKGVSSEEVSDIIVRLGLDKK